MFNLTLVSATSSLNAGHIKGVSDYLANSNVQTLGEADWLDMHIAADIPLASKPHLDRIKSLRQSLQSDKIDIFISGHNHRRKKLLLADMDSTIVQGETLDELADIAGKKEEIAAITTRAMNGEIDFAQALAARVDLLKGLSVEALEQTAAAMTVNKGARALVHIMKEHGAKTVLISGGFTVFTAKIAADLGFDAHHGNVLEISDNKLEGTVQAPILDNNTKYELLQHYRDFDTLQPDNILAIGDGANDLNMLKAAGTGVGYHPKQIILDEIANCIIHGDLTAALYLQGYRNLAANGANIAQF